MTRHHLSGRPPALARALTGVVAGLGLALGALVVPASPASAAVGVPGVRADDGAFVVSETRVGPQILDLTVSSPALGRTAPVRLYLPTDYLTRPDKTWAQLWMLHGANEREDYRSWTTFTDAEQFLATKKVLVVQPSASSAALYSDPYGFLGLGGGPKWETFHTVELPQLIDRAYRGDPARRAVAGLSSGGLGAMKYAERHPGLFKAAASYSGLLDTLQLGGPTVVRTIELRGGVVPNWTWGDPLLALGSWRRNNPSDNVAPLAGMPLYVSAGNGSRGPLDTGLFAGDTIEPGAQTAARTFSERARAAGARVTVDLYGGGTHSWPYWAREFKDSWPMLATALGVPV